MEYLSLVPIIAIPACLFFFAIRSDGVVTLEVFVMGILLGLAWPLTLMIATIFGLFWVFLEVFEPNADRVIYKCKRK